MTDLSPQKPNPYMGWVWVTDDGDVSPILHHGKNAKPVCESYGRSIKRPGRAMLLCEVTDLDSTESDRVIALDALAVVANRAELHRDLALDALAVFAALYQPHHHEMSDDRPVFGINGALVTVGDIRAARAILRELRPQHSAGASLE